MTAPALAVAPHDVEPGTLGRCRFIRHWMYAWYGGLPGIHAAPPPHTPAHARAPRRASTATCRAALLRIGVHVPMTVLRLDVHPADFELSSHVCALAAALRQARDRRPVSYDEPAA
jgi:hypothetical protein